VAGVSLRNMDVVRCTTVIETAQEEGWQE
jgi:hypothetical protein